MSPKADQPTAAAVQLDDVLREELAHLVRHRPGGRNAKEVERGLIGLALSGGGIRSATTNLGVLQALSAMHVLPLVDYLCTVSGGGYIGSCLSSLLSLNEKAIPTTPGERPTTAANAAKDDPCAPYRFSANDKRAFGTLPDRFPFRADRTDPRGLLGTDIVAHLRTHGNFLIARRGLLSRDTMRAIGNLVTGAVYNVLGFLLVLLAASASYLTVAFLLAPDAPPAFGSSSVNWQPLDIARPRTDTTSTTRVESRTEPCAAPSVGCSVESRTALAPPSRTTLMKHDIGIAGAPFASAWHMRTGEEDENRRARLILRLMAIALGLGGLLTVIAFFALSAMLARYKAGDGRFVAHPEEAGESEETAFDDGVLRRLALFAAGWVVLTTIALRSLAMPGGAPRGTLLLSGHYQLVLLFVPFAVLLGARASNFALAALLPTLFKFLAVVPLFRGRWTRRWRSLWGGFQAITMYGAWLSFVFALAAPLMYALRDYRGSIGAGGLGALVVSRLLTSRSGATPRIGRLRLPTGVMHFLLALVIVAVVTLGVLFFGSVLLSQTAGPHGEIDGGLLASIAGISLAALVALGFLVDHNKVSPHYFYRDRLAETYLFTEVPDTKRRLWMLRDAMEMPLRCLHGDPASAADKEWRNPAPYHLVSAAINLAGSHDLTRKDRKSGYWLFSKLYCGSVHTGFRLTAQYRRGETKLARAAAISGAAASSAAGFATFFAQAFAAVLFNVRLGNWIENPAQTRSLTHQEGRVFWPWYLLKEVTMTTSADDHLVNLSDGGHTGDNVGMYPLFQRQCKVIIACDAECDPALSFGSFTEVLRHAYVDLGVSVDIDLSMIRPDPTTGLSRSHCAVGRIHYPQRPDQQSYLIYIKNSLTGDEPAPVQNYKTTSAHFPHESTADQFFSDAQFESYRALGVHLAEHTFGRWVTTKAFENVRSFHWPQGEPVPAAAP